MNLLKVCTFMCISSAIASLCEAKSLVTFNTYLLPGSNNYECRRQAIPSALRALHADVVCLQEVWFERDMKLILDNVRPSYSFSWSSLHDSTTHLQQDHSSIVSRLLRPLTNFVESPCTSTTFLTLSWCILTNCVGSSDIFGCGTTHCLDKLLDLPQTCLVCLLVAKDTPKQIFSRCFGITMTHGNGINPSGLLMLSKHDIESPSYNRFFPGLKQIFPRAYIKTEMSDIGTLLCTHLTTAGYPYVDLKVSEALGFKSWEMQQRAEIDILVGTDADVIMGDFNNGPTLISNNITAELPNNYEHMIQQGYRNHYISHRPAECTFCKNNPLRRLTADQILDHIFVKNVDIVQSERVLAVPGTCQALSDHYGVKVDIGITK